MNIGVVTALVAAAVSVIGGLVTLLTLKAQRQKLTAEGAKTKADAVKVLSETAISLLAPMEARAAALERQLQMANTEIEQLRVKLADADRRAAGLNDRLMLAQRLLDQHGVPFPPVEG